MLKIEANPNIDTKKYMFDMWDRMDVPETTKQKYYEHVTEDGMYIRNIGIMKKHIDFVGKKCLDIGCGWGSLTCLLQKEGAEMYAVEPVPEHAQVTANRCPQAHVFQENACNLPFIDESFDIVISHSIIEHIDTCGRRGLSVKNDQKQAHLNEMARVLKIGGRGFLNTGNFVFPLDGEVDKFLFHWMPPKVQNEWLAITGESADTYSMLMWPTIKRMIHESGLTIIEVVNPDIECWRPHLEKISGFTPPIIEMILKLIETNPNFMNSWHILLEKKEKILISGDEC